MNDKRTTQNALKGRIMRRIYFVFALRSLLNPLFLKSLIAIVFLWRSTTYISYAQVFANAPTWTDIPRNLAFARDAMMHTETTSIALVLSFAVLCAWLASDVMRKHYHTSF